MSPPKPPVIAELARWELALSCAAIITAVLILAELGIRIASGISLWQWWVPVAVVAGIASADFASGLVHWSADTWGRSDLPLIGRRLLLPFRTHHMNPNDLLRRRFLETNSEVAFLAIPVLLGLRAIPLHTAWGGPAAVWGLALCGIGILTNQIHQWAHMPSPPRPVRILQDCGLLLPRSRHAAHHQRPFDTGYCITTGWCNAPLEAIGFFRNLEAMITRLSGAHPRDDDRRCDDGYREARHG